VVDVQAPQEKSDAIGLPQYIRNPKSVRSWEGSKMPGFGTEVFSDEHIADVIAYLKEMALEKSRPN
jgi:cytochrome c2